MAESRRVMISLPDQLLAEVDGLASAENLNRSQLFREAVQQYIAERKKRQIREQMIRGYLEMAPINLSLVNEYMGLEVDGSLPLWQLAEGE